MSDEKSKNVYKQWYTIKFCVKLKKTLTETKNMLDATYNESVMSQASVCYSYNEFKSGRKNVELMGGPDTPTTALIEQSTLVQLWSSTIFI